MKRLLASVLLCSLILSGCGLSPGTKTPETKLPPLPSGTFKKVEAAEFGAAVNYEEPSTAIDAGLAKDFSTEEITNLSAIEKAYGFTLSSDEKKFLSENKFLVKNLLDTSIRPTLPRQISNNGREFVGLYHAVSGSPDPRDRKPENSVFYTSDVFASIYTILFTELLKEMENEYFEPALATLTETFYKAAAKKIEGTIVPEEKAKWTKIRNYFSIPYAILQTVGKQPSAQDYMAGNPDDVGQAFADADKEIDTLENVTAFVKKLKLDAPSEEVVLADLKQIYGAQGKGVPVIFKSEFEEYGQLTHKDFYVDFTQFTPRSHYTNSSLRRQYFRAVMWMNKVPFFLKSPALTSYAFAATQLLAEYPQQLRDYSDLESMISFLVGESDDLMPVDYMNALAEAKGSSAPEQAVLDYLIKARNPKIKDLAATYGSVGTEKSDEVLLATKGMRFFSGKFLIDSYWTGFLTQGDEAARPGYPGKLPPMASSLEVMALLGCDYARSKIPTLDFYKNYGAAVDKGMADLTAETATLDTAYWQRNVYSAALWAIKGLFGWQEANVAKLPQFMQSPLWGVKTLQAAAGMWTEMRHAVLLYAKQSFAELGGGPGACDSRKVPEPPKGYIEPQPAMYARLLYLAQRTDKGISERGFELKNLPALHSYVTLLEQVNSYVADELANTKAEEKLVSHTDPDMMNPGKTCQTNGVADGSRFEQIRRLVEQLDASLPEPVEGPILPAKDKRAALLADVHTGGDSRILYEGIGVPRVILVAVKDVNGPRLTVGFTYSQYEFTEPYGGKRLTDEQWQEKFFTGSDPYDPYRYTDKASWPAENSWYAPILGK